MANEVIGGYQLKTHLMTGQSSQVWEVVEVASSRHFAMKILLPEAARDPEKRQLLIHEAEVGIALRHANVIKIITVNKKTETPYFVMEFFPSGALKLRIVRKQADFLREKAHEILKQAATGLAYMNASGWVHRDIKPDNILVNSAGEVRLIDFALAQRIRKENFLSRIFRRKGLVQGTRSYMAPEQIRGQPLDGRSDIYSFGCSCYELVTSRPPFRGSSNFDLLNKQLNEKPTTPQAHNRDVTDEFAEFVLLMLRKNREERPRDFHEVLMKLRTIRVYKEVAHKE